jgi:hypothetical protein
MCLFRVNSKRLTSPVPIKARVPGSGTAVSPVSAKYDPSLNRKLIVPLAPPPMSIGWPVSAITAETENSASTPTVKSLPLVGKVKEKTAYLTGRKIQVVKVTTEPDAPAINEYVDRKSSSCRSRCVSLSEIEEAEWRPARYEDEDSTSLVVKIQSCLRCHRLGPEQLWYLQRRCPDISISNVGVAHRKRFMSPLVQQVFVARWEWHGKCYRQSSSSLKKNVAIVQLFRWFAIFDLNSPLARTTPSPSFWVGLLTIPGSIRIR